MKKNSEILPNKIDGWNFTVNRINKLMPMVVNKLNTCHVITKFKKKEDEEISLQETLFTYVDTYGGVRLSESSKSFPRIIQLLERRYTNPLADKLRMGRMASESNLHDYIPPTYETKEAADIGLKSTNTPLCFIKGRFGTGGKQVNCCKSENVASLELPVDHIIQAGVNNIWLYEEKKVVIRFYVLLSRKKIWLGRPSFAVVHGIDYDPLSPDFDIQIKHEGYAQRDSRVRLLPLFKIDNYKIWQNALLKALKGIYVMLKPISDLTDYNTYSLLGIDGIPCSDETVKIIEINNYPNMNHTQEINTTVNIPVISSLMLFTVRGINDGTWVTVEEVDS